MEVEDDGFFLVIIGDEGEFKKVSTRSESVPVTSKQKGQYEPESAIIVGENIDSAVECLVRMEVEDDGFFLVIIGDEGEFKKVSTGSESVPVTSKQKRQYEPESALIVGENIDSAEKPGEYIGKGQIPGTTRMKRRPFFNENLGEALTDSEDNQIDEENDTYKQEEINMKYLQVRKFAKCKEKPGKKYIKRQCDVSQTRSYIKQLKIEHPEIKYKSPAFVQLIADIMKSIKPPPPPRDYYRISNLNYECIECCQELKSITAVTRHYQSYHGPLYLKCFACGAEYRSPNNLYKHEKRCRAPDAIIVLQARALAMVKRGRKRPFMQPKIPRKEMNMRYLRKQIQKHKCTECPAEFRTEGSLTAHMYIHRGERPYLCPVCSATYTTSCALHRHMEIHSDNKYVCDYCQKEFQRKTSIQYHISTHMPTNKFPCTYDGCGRYFQSRPTLNAHINKIHKKLPPPCVCEVCPKRYAKTSALKVHMREKHGLILMTRNMLFKSLPKLSQTEVQQAKVVFKDKLENASIIADTEEKEKDKIWLVSSVVADDSLGERKTVLPDRRTVSEKKSMRKEDQEIIEL